MVNTKDVQLDFDIQDVGSSQVKGVEVWYTQDDRSWTKLPEDAPPKPPYTVKLPGEGRYGITLIARSGVGLGLPTPKPGDAPQVWVEVDTTKPEVKNLKVEVNRGQDLGTLTVHWLATDLHMRANPITISYMDAKEGGAGQWQIMAANIPNPPDGRFTWRMPIPDPAAAHSGARGGGRSGRQRRRRHYAEPRQHRPVDSQSARHRRNGRRSRRRTSTRWLGRPGPLPLQDHACGYKITSSKRQERFIGSPRSPCHVYARPSADRGEPH